MPLKSVGKATIVSVTSIRIYATAMIFEEDVFMQPGSLGNVMTVKIISVKLSAGRTRHAAHIESF